MSRVGRDGVGEQINIGSRWVKEAWEIKNKVGGGSFDKRSVAKMIQLPQLPSKDPSELWMLLRDNLDLNTQEKRLLALRSMLIAVATKQAWVRMESFAKSGAAEGNFDVSCLLSDVEDSKCKKKDKINWEAVSNLISAATVAAVGAGKEREEEEMVELLGCLSELRMFAAEGCRTQNEARSVGGEVKSRIMTPEQSELLFLRAVQRRAFTGERL